MKARDLPPQTYTMEELSGLSGFSKRSIRRHIQAGLVARPSGRTSNARYGPVHLQQLWEVGRLSGRGLTFKQIQAALAKERDALNGLGSRIGGGFDLRMEVIEGRILLGFLRPRTLTADQEHRLLKQTRRAYLELISGGE
jgi:DNA-binding transcriptional MerR regulator